MLSLLVWMSPPPGRGHLACQSNAAHSVIAWTVAQTAEFFDRMPMPVWKTGAAMSRVTTVVTAALLCVSCGPAEQGYWTKQDISQALTNEQYPADSQHCERFAAQNDGRYSDKAREKRYTKCMSARGYQWVVEEPVSFPEKSSGQSSRAHSCPAGYTNCVPAGTKDGGLNPEVNQSITQEESSYQKAESLPPNPSHQSNEKRLVEDRECRHQADATLSSPYGVYVTCMQEKGWSSPPAVGATADSAENENTRPQQGPHAGGYWTGSAKRGQEH